MIRLIDTLFSVNTMCMLKGRRDDMTKKLIKHGNSAALVVDKALMDVLNINMDTPLEITTRGLF
jgi:hypothetical protein